MNEDDKKPGEQYDPWTDAPQQSQPPASPAQPPSPPPKKKWFSRKKPEDSENWERDVISRLAFSALNEQRRARRWGIFFKVLLFIYLFAILFYVPGRWDSERLSIGPHTALVDMKGVIADDSEASADNLITGLRAAFEDKNSKGVILRINSPGGSPVQAGYVYDEIQRLRDEFPDKKLYAVVTDMCASGGYYIASAADEIYANEASIVGSIGVLMDGFGFTEAMKKLGIERRLMTAGEHKGVLDPFSPLKPEEVKHVQTLLGQVHEQFINAVRNGRGDRLHETPDIFSGLFWTGEEGVELGLVDALGSSSYVAREIIQAEKIVDYTPRGNPFDQFIDRFGVAMAKGFSQVMGLQPSLK